jgi:prepilin-type N-terminal cleavage/methylation domain-containing protein
MVSVGAGGSANDSRAGYGRRYAARKRQAWRRGRGFTMLELMMSLAVMTVGAAALFSLQGFIARANLHARRVTQATEIADKWIERLKTDALLWSDRGFDGMGGTAYLNQIATANTWLQAAGNLPNQVNDVLMHSSGADMYGRDVIPLASTTPGAIAYCTHYRLSWVTTPADTSDDTSLRVEVRVLWAKEISGLPASGVSLADTSGVTPNCATTNIPAATLANLHAVYVATIIRYTPTS